MMFKTVKIWCIKLRDVKFRDEKAWYQLNLRYAFLIKGLT
jgi:hypothetical protein